MIPDATIAAVAGCLTCVIPVFFIWVHSSRSQWAPPRRSLKRVSLALLLLHVAANNLLFEKAADVSQIVDQGLSLTNLFQVGCVGLAAFWSLLLFASRRMTGQMLWHGPRIWLTLLTALYATSSAWSLWPQLTAYRAFELAVFIVLCIHAFDGEDWHRTVCQYLCACLAIAWVAPMMELSLRSSVGGFESASKSNVFSITAGLALSYVSFANRTWKRGTRVLLGACAATTLIITSSLASFVSCLIAVAVSSTFTGTVGKRLLGGGCALLLVGVGLALIADEKGVETAIYASADLLGKPVKNIENATGRLPLWTALITWSMDYPLGSGFDAGERLFSSTSANETVGFKAYHSHNGYLSAWVGAGAPGLALMTLLCLATAVHVSRQPRSTRPLLVAMYVLIAVNNLTYIAVGGRFNPVWPIWIALCCIPCRAFHVPAPLRPAPFTSLVSATGRYNA